MTDERIKEELNPCPFCGESAKFIEYDTGDWQWTENDYMIICTGAQGHMLDHVGSKSELATIWNTRAASYHAEQCKACNKWISVKDRLPENCNGVLVFGINESGKSRKAKAMYARKFELEANDEAVDSGFFEYDESRDESYVPEGWYEDNSCSETDYVIDFTVTHWQPLPEAPLV